MITSRRLSIGSSPAWAAAAVLATAVAHAQYSPVWFDGFTTSQQGTDINLEYALRQGGPPAPYVANPRPPGSQPSDYHQQLIGPVWPASDRLLLAGDAGAGLSYPDPTIGLALVQPDLNFKGPGAGGIMGKRITLDLDVYANASGSGAHYVQAGLSLGSAAGLVYGSSPTPHFGIRFVEDSMGGPANSFIQLYDGAALVGNLLTHAAGTGWAQLDVRIDDPADGNPWDGVGSTQIDVFVNGAAVGSYTKGNGGYTDNYLTLEGSADFNGFGLATHHYDNLTVYATPVPEPATGALAVGGMLGAMALWRMRKGRKDV